MNLSATNIIYILIILILVIVGIVQIVKKRPLGYSEEEYTVESLEEFSLIMGVMTILAALGFCLVFEGITGAFTGHSNTNMMMVGDLAIIMIVFAQTFLSRRILKKKASKSRRKIVNNKKKKR